MYSVYAILEDSLAFVGTEIKKPLQRAMNNKWENLFDAVFRKIKVIITIRFNTHKKKTNKLLMQINACLTRSEYCAYDAPEN